MMPYGPESHVLEYKSQLPPTEKLARTLVAFANSRGGRLVIGYDKSSDRITGAKIDSKAEQHLANIGHTVCKPSLEYTLKYETLGYKTLTLIEVPEGIKNLIILVAKAEKLALLSE